MALDRWSWTGQRTHRPPSGSPQQSLLLTNGWAQLPSMMTWMKTPPAPAVPDTSYRLALPNFTHPFVFSFTFKVPLVWTLSPVKNVSSCAVINEALIIWQSTNSNVLIDLQEHDCAQCPTSSHCHLLNILWTWNLKKKKKKLKSQYNTVFVRFEPWAFEPQFAFNLYYPAVSKGHPQFPSIWRLRQWLQYSPDTTVHTAGSGY